jgi:uncharacterized protein (TIGR03086 family)
MTTDITGLIEQATDLTASVIAAVDDDQWERPSPCRRFDVERLVKHVIGATRWFAAIPERHIDPEEETIELRVPSPEAVYRDAVAAGRDAWADPALLAEVYTFAWGQMSGQTAAEWMLLETLVHGWDIAASTDQPYDPDAALVTAATEVVERLDEAVLRADGMFGPPVEVPADAPAFDRLLGLLGRDPAAGTANC